MIARALVPDVVDWPADEFVDRSVSARVIDTEDMSDGAWHLALAEAWLPPPTMDLSHLFGEHSHPTGVDVWYTTRVSVTPRWSHAHAIAAVGGLLARLDDLGSGLLLDVHPYHDTSIDDRRRYVSWLVERGFRVVRGTRRKPTVMYRPPGGGR